MRSSVLMRAGCLETSKMGRRWRSSVLWAVSGIMGRALVSEARPWAMGTKSAKASGRRNV